MPRENKLVQCKLTMTMTQGNYFRLQHLQKNMKAGILPNICELTTTRIIVRGRI